MDREAIERRDFPVGRRGYDQAAVDAHLRRVADELAALTAGTPTLAAGASEQVRVILEAAEAGAAELRADAARRADEHVARVEQAAGAMMARIDELERDLGSLLEALRRSGEKLSEGLARLHEQAGELAAAPGNEEREPAPAGDADAAAPASDEAGARLIALNMALGGSPREETARYLAEHFALADAGALLDDVYERAGQ